MVKNIFSLILVSTIFLTLFAGCQMVKEEPPKGADAPKSTTSSGKANFNETGYPIVDEEITVTCMFAVDKQYVGDDPNETTYWKRLRELTNIRIDWILLEPDETVVNLYFAAGDFPDYFMGSLTQERINTYGIKGGVFIDISDMLYKYMPHLVSRFKEWPQAEKVIRQYNGEVYTVPQVRLGTTAYNGQIHFRNDYMTEAGLKRPETIDEFYDTLKKIKNSGLTKGFAPLLPYSKAHLETVVEDLLFPAFGEASESNFGDDGNGNVVFNRTSEQFRRYLEFMNKLYKEELLEKEIFSIDPATTIARVKSGQAAFFTDCSNLLPEDFLDGKMGIDCLTPLMSDYTSTRKVRSYPYISTRTGGINKNCKYPEAILRMLDIAYAKEEVAPGTGLEAVACNMGPKGVSYDVDTEKNTYHVLAPPEEERVAKYGDSNIWMWLRKTHGWNVPYGVYDLPYFNDDINAYAREKSCAENLIPYTIDRFPDELLKYTDEEITKMANKLTDINNYVKQMRAKFITGVEPFSNWDDYVATLSKMGIEEVLKIKQAAYDRWNK